MEIITSPPYFNAIIVNAWTLTSSIVLCLKSLQHPLPCLHIRNRIAIPRKSSQLTNEVGTDTTESSHSLHRHTKLTEGTLSNIFASLCPNLSTQSLITYKPYNTTLQALRALLQNYNLSTKN
ncbi:hypothetical protein M758_UG171400 [Ceratodon purpureus]|nr:hypothetical protein M758_UG171400 [Ceratodon purpureus]